MTMASPLHHPNRLFVLLPRFWASRDQPIPGSFPKKDPGYEVELLEGKLCLAIIYSKKMTMENARSAAN